MEFITQKILLILALLLLVIAGIGLIMYFLKKRFMKNLFNLDCEIYLKNGDRVVLKKTVTQNEFEMGEGKNKKTYFIVKDAIRKSISKKLFKTTIDRFMSFDEDIALPFILGLVNGKPEKKYLGSEKARQLIRGKIFDEIGGVGNSNLMEDNKMVIIIAAVGLVATIVVVFLFKGG